VGGLHIEYALCGIFWVVMGNRAWLVGFCGPPKELVGLVVLRMALVHCGIRGTPEGERGHFVDIYHNSRWCGWVCGLRAPRVARGEPAWPAVARGVSLGLAWARDVDLG